MADAQAALDGNVLEALEPFPDLHELFVLYNDLYFHGGLGATSVQWSSRRMTRCAGTCWHKKDGGCIIKLSEPLLKFRPSIDLKETLLHEMVHAHIFLTNQARRDGDHGPLFIQMVTDINTSTVPDSQRPPGGYHVSVTHTFVAEVRNYQNHHWECKRCGNLVRRAMNRPPQAADCRTRSGATCADVRCAYHQHVRHCGGEYVKVAEPEGYADTQRKKRKAPNQEQPKFAANGAPVPPQRPNAKPRPEPGTRSILDFFPKAEPSASGAAADGTGGPPSPAAPDQARRAPPASPSARRIDDSPSAKRRLLAEAAERRLAAVQDGVSCLAAARQLPPVAGGRCMGRAAAGDTGCLLDGEGVEHQDLGSEVARLSSGQDQGKQSGASSCAAANAKQEGTRIGSEQDGMRDGVSSINQGVGGELCKSSGACAVDLTGEEDDGAKPDGLCQTAIL